MDKLKRRGTAQLLKNLENTTGEELEAVKAILITRGKMPAENPKDNVGKECSFVKNGSEIRGIIKGLMTDKRVDCTYYRIISFADRLYHKKINSQKLTIYG